MVVKVISSQIEDSWYADAIGMSFNVYTDKQNNLYYFADPFLPILKMDVKLISNTVNINEEE